MKDIKSTNPKLRLCSDGQYLYTICEVTGPNNPGKSLSRNNSIDGSVSKKYYVDMFDIVQKEQTLTVNLMKRIELPAFDPAAPKGQDGISCNGCHRMNFRLKRHRCTVCSNYNLCHTCLVFETSKFKLL